MARRGNIYDKDKEKEEQSDIIQNIDNETKETKNITDNKREKRQIIFLICFVVICIAITAGLLIFKLKNNTDNDKLDDSLIESGNYGITDYKEMYYINPLQFKEERYSEKEGEQYKIDINYIVVSGLKDKKLQDKINKEIKDAAYKYYNNVGSGEDYLVYTYVAGNFNNVLSINLDISIWNSANQTYSLNEMVGLNYNLLTGEKILLTDVLLPTTPINYIIYNIAYEDLAWDTKVDFDTDQETWEQNMNMDNRDTSEYEDIILRNIMEFNKTSINSKEFYITPARVHIKMKIGNNEEEYFAGIPLYKYAEHVGIYKKFLANETKLKEVYETLPTKQRLVFTDNVGIEPYYEDHIYDNLFLSLITLSNEEYDENIVKNYPESTIILKDELVEKNVVDIMNRVKALARDNKNYGYITRAMIDTNINTFDNDYGKEDYIQVYVELVVDKCDISYYKSSAFKSLAARILSPKVDVWGAVLGDLNDKNITRVEKESISLEYFYDTNGRLIAKNWEELEVYMSNKYNEKQDLQDISIYSE